MQCRTWLDNCTVQDLHSHCRYIFLLSLLLFVAISHYIMLEVMNLISPQPRSCCPAHQCCMWQNQAPGCYHYYRYRLCLPSKPSSETKRAIWRKGHQSAWEYSEMWPKSGSFRSWFCADQWQTIRDRSRKQQSEEREKPFQSKLPRMRQTSSPSYKHSLPRLPHSPGLKHSEDHHSQLLHWEGMDDGGKLLSDAKRRPFPCFPAPQSSLICNTLLALLWRAKSNLFKPASGLLGSLMPLSHSWCVSPIPLTFSVLPPSPFCQVSAFSSSSTVSNAPQLLSSLFQVFFTLESAIP